MKELSDKDIEHKNVPIFYECYEIKIKNQYVIIISMEQLGMPFSDKIKKNEYQNYSLSEKI